MGTTRVTPGSSIASRGRPPAPEQKSGSIGLGAATALVMGSIIGTGVLALPSALAAYGPVSLVAVVAVTIGSVALALVFGALSRRYPDRPGPRSWP